MKNMESFANISFKPEVK